MLKSVRCLWFCVFAGSVFVVAYESNQVFFWRDYEPNYLPNDAFEAASGRYIGQFVFQDSLLVATLYPFTNTAIGELYGQKNARHNIKIFCTPQAHKFYWEMVNFSNPNDLQMKNVVKGGYEKGIDADLYIGKAVQDGEWKIGKVIDIIYSSRGLWVTDQSGKAVTIKEFFVLKYNSSDVGPQLMFT